MSEPRFVVAGMVMAIVAGDIIGDGMLIMLKKDAAGGAGVIDADGLIRVFGGEKGVTE